MTYAEYEGLITDSLANVDKAPVNLKQVLEAIKADTTTIESLTTKVAEQDTRIRDLQDTNMKLFLGQTGAGKSGEVEVPEPTTGKEAVDELVSLLTTEEVSDGE